MIKASYQGLAILALSVSIAGCFLAGCGSSGGPDPHVEKLRTEKLTEIRALYDKVHGDYSALSASDKATYLKLCDNDGSKAETTWNLMKSGPVKPPAAATTAG